MKKLKNYNTVMNILKICSCILFLKALYLFVYQVNKKRLMLMFPKLATLYTEFILQLQEMYTKMSIYLKSIAPLQYQKNMRELEVIVKECVLNTVRESIPVAQILRAYIDETVEEEDVEENIGIQPKEDEENETAEGEENDENSDTPTVEKSESSGEASGIVKKETTKLFPTRTS